jgi:hypothetical protein
MDDKKRIKLAIGRANQLGEQVFDEDQFALEDGLYFVRFIERALALSRPRPDDIDEIDGITIRPARFPTLVYGPDNLMSIFKRLFYALLMPILF